MIRYFLIFANVVSLATGLMFILSIHRIPPTIPSAIVENANSLSKDQVISNLVSSNVAVDHASNLLWICLDWWIGISVLNLVVWIASVVNKR